MFPFLLNDLKSNVQGGDHLKSLETNDWIVLNNIIYKIYTNDDFETMRHEFMEQLKMILDFDSADFYLADGNNKEGLTDPVFFNCDDTEAAKWDTLDYSRGIMYGGKPMVYRETDIISDEKRRNSEYYRQVYMPNNWHYSMQMVLARNKEFMGVVTFYRTIGKDDFRYDDIFILDTLKDHLSYRLFEERKRTHENLEKYTVSKAASKFSLTKREETILGMLMQGTTNDEICSRLCISVNTLKKHILNLYRKLGVRNRVQLFKMILEHDGTEQYI